MDRAPSAARTHVDLARTGSRVGNELGNGTGWDCWIEQHHVGHAGNASNRHDVMHEIEIELVVERGVGRVRVVDQEQRITVRGRIYDSLGGNIAARARPILNNEPLAEPLRQPLTDEARGDVVPTPRRKAD